MSTLSPNIRIATIADIPALHALAESAYRGDSARRGWTHEADLLEGQRTDAQTLRTMFEAPDETVLLLEEGATIIGCVHLKPAEAPGTAYLGLFAITPDRQAGGLGRALLAAAEDHAARMMGASAIEMTVIGKRADLIAWYERRGYVRTGEGRPFPHDDPRFGLPVTRDLDFIVLVKQLA